MNYDKFQKLIPIVRDALKEDIGKKDITTELVIPENKLVKADLLALEDCVVCGLDIVGLVFKEQDNRIQFKSKVLDGQCIKKGTVLAQIRGRARSILTAERVALNFLSLLSGIATKTKEFVDKVKPYKVNPVRKNGKRKKIGFSNGVKIMDTRKTIPGLRELEKYAVRKGGGYNHRMKLDEMVLVKDNHLKIMGDLKSLAKLNKKYKIEIEVKNLKEFKEALKSKPDIIMLDNMSVKDIKRAAQIRNELFSKIYGKIPQLEASGGINLGNVRKVASCGIDLISIGELTDSIKSIDISLEIL